MKKWAKRLWMSMGTTVGLLVAVVLVLLALVRATPRWYQPSAMTPQQREAAAQSATNKLAMVQNEAAKARADEQAARQHNPATRPANAITVSFSEDEINAFLEKWSVWQNVRAGYEQFLVDPVIVLRDGRVILAGKLREIDAIASMHFEPRIDQQGRLHLVLARVLSGKLPLPQDLLTHHRQRATAAVQRRIPLWRRQAKIDDSGIANSSAISAAMSQLLVDVLGERPTNAILFLPLVDHGSIPVKLLDVRVEDRTLTLTVQPMTASERTELLRRIRAATAGVGQELR